MSGYDKSPDYGGPEPTTFGAVMWVVGMIATMAVVVLILTWLQS